MAGRKNDVTAIDLMTPNKQVSPIKPMLALAADRRILPELANDDAYSFQQKMDGKRLILVADNGKITAYNRSGVKTDLPNYLQISIKAALKEGTFVLDGEIMRVNERLSHLFLFDMPVAGELITPASPYIDRLTALRELVRLCWPNDQDARVSVLGTVDESRDKARMPGRLLSVGAEGIIVRRKDGKYAPGKRTQDMLKVKFIHSADCEVIEIGRDGKDNLVLGCYDDQGKQVEVGVVSRLTGDGKAAVLGCVLEVSFLHFSPGGRMVQPTMPRLRLDKAARDCSMNQFTPVDLRALLPEAGA